MSVLSSVLILLALTHVTVLLASEYIQMVVAAMVNLFYTEVDYMCEVK